VARFAARTLTAQLVPAFCRPNFGDDEEYQWLVPDIEEEEENFKLLAETFEVVARIGVKIPPKYAHERLRMPQPVGGEEVLAAAPSGPERGDSKTKVSARSVERSLAPPVAESVTGVGAEWLRGNATNKNA
jgi:phage gp29-like protein